MVAEEVLGQKVVDARYYYLDGQEEVISGGFGPDPNFGPPVNTDNSIFIGRDNREPRSPNGWIDHAIIRGIGCAHHAI